MGERKQENFELQRKLEMLKEKEKKCRIKYLLLKIPVYILCLIAVGMCVFGIFHFFSVGFSTYMSMSFALFIYTAFSWLGIERWKEATFWKIAYEEVAIEKILEDTDD